MARVTKQEQDRDKKVFNKHSHWWRWKTFWDEGQMMFGFPLHGVAWRGMAFPNLMPGATPNQQKYSESFRIGCF